MFAEVIALRVLLPFLMLSTGLLTPTLRCHSRGRMGWKMTLIPSEAICWLATVLNSTGYISYKPFNCGVIQMHRYPAGTKCYFV